MSTSATSHSLAVLFDSPRSPSDPSKRSSHNTSSSNNMKKYQQQQQQQSQSHNHHHHNSTTHSTATSGSASHSRSLHRPLNDNVNSSSDLTLSCGSPPNVQNNVTARLSPSTALNATANATTHAQNQNQATATATTTSASVPVSTSPATAAAQLQTTYSTSTAHTDAYFARPTRRMANVTSPQPSSTFSHPTPSSSTYTTTSTTNTNTTANHSQTISREHTSHSIAPSASHATTSVYATAPSGVIEYITNTTTFVPSVTLAEAAEAGNTTTASGGGAHTADPNPSGSAHPVTTTGDQYLQSPPVNSTSMTPIGTENRSMSGGDFRGYTSGEDRYRHHAYVPSGRTPVSATPPSTGATATTTTNSSMIAPPLIPPFSPSQRNNSNTMMNIGGGSMVSDSGVPTFGGGSDHHHHLRSPENNITSPTAVTAASATETKTTNENNDENNNNNNSNSRSASVRHISDKINRLMGLAERAEQTTARHKQRSGSQASQLASSLSIPPLSIPTSPMKDQGTNGNNNGLSNLTGVISTAIAAATPTSHTTDANKTMARAISDTYKVSDLGDLVPSTRQSPSQLGTGENNNAGRTEATTTVTVTAAATTKSSDNQKNAADLLDLDSHRNHHHRHDIGGGDPDIRDLAADTAALAAVTLTPPMTPTPSSSSSLWMQKKLEVASAQKDSIEKNREAEQDVEGNTELLKTTQQQSSTSYSTHTNTNTNHHRSGSGLSSRKASCVSVGGSSSISNSSNMIAQRRSSSSSTGSRRHRSFATISPVPGTTPPTNSPPLTASAVEENEKWSAKEPEAEKGALVERKEKEVEKPRRTATLTKFSKVQFQAEQQAEQQQQTEHKRGGDSRHGTPQGAKQLIGASTATANTAAARAGRTRSLMTNSPFLNHLHPSSSSQPQTHQQFHRSTSSKTGSGGVENSNVNAASLLSSSGHSDSRRSKTPTSLSTAMSIVKSEH